MTNTIHTIVSCQEQSEEFACFELRASGHAVESLAPGILGVYGIQPFAEISRAAQHAELLFLQHLMPVELTLPSTTGEEALIAQLLPLAIKSAGQKIAIHMRSFDSEWQNERVKAFSRRLNDMLATQGVTVGRAQPQQLLTLVIAKGQIYIGLSTPQESLSSWPGGAIRYRNEPEQISRSEFKLLEALTVFQIPVIAGQRAVDLGAAPGGWSRVLAERGLLVHAVDPAALDTRLTKERRITHLKMTAQEFLDNANKQGAHYHLLVNDMRMEAVESAALTARAATLLDKDGWVVITFKLPALSTPNTFELLRNARLEIQKNFDCVGMRQLFHNRSEVTGVFRARTATGSNVSGLDRGENGAAHGN